MEAISRIALISLLVGLVGCTTPRVIVVPQEIPKVERPTLPIETLKEDATAAEVAREIEASLLVCIGYSKQLEAAQSQE